MTTQTENKICIRKAADQLCISKLSPDWTDEQLGQMVEMFQAHGLV